MKKYYVEYAMRTDSRWAYYVVCRPRTLRPAPPEDMSNAVNGRIFSSIAEAGAYRQGLEDSEAKP